MEDAKVALHMPSIRALRITLSLSTCWLSFSRVWVGHYERLLSWFHSLFSAGVHAHECIEKRQVELPTRHARARAFAVLRAHRYTLYLKQMSVIHLYPQRAASADRDICIPNFPSTTVTPPPRASWDNQGQGRGGTGSLLQTCTHTHTHTLWDTCTIMQTVSNQFDANVKQSSV